MTANTSPIFTLTPDISNNNGTVYGGAITLAVGSNYDGTQANYVLIHTAGANGSFVGQIRCKAIGTNVATVARVFANNNSTVGTAANNDFVDEINLPATTASNTTATPTIYFPLNLRMAPNSRLYIGLATAVAAGWVFTAEAGQY